MISGQVRLNFPNRCDLIGMVRAVATMMVVACGGRLETTAPASTQMPTDGAGESPTENTAMDASSCPAAGIIAIATQSGGYSMSVLDPPTMAITTLGPVIACPPGLNIDSLAVDDEGGVRVVVGDVSIYAIQGLSCGSTALIPQAPGPGILQPVALTFARPALGAPEMLYGSFYDNEAPVPSRLGTLVLADASPIGTVNGGERAGVPVQFAPTVDEQFQAMTGTNDGRLFAVPVPQNAIVQLDPWSGATLGSIPLSDAGIWGAQAIAFWAGDLFVFSGQGGAADGGTTTSVYRVHLMDGTSTLVAQMNGLVVAANSSTCAPLE